MKRVKLSSFRGSTAGRIITIFGETYRVKWHQNILTIGRKLNQKLIDSRTEIFDFIDIAEAKLG